MQITITILYILAIPLGVMLLAKRWSWIEKITPMTVLYIIGLIVGNCGIIGSEEADACNMVSNLAVPICLPLMLFGCSLKNWSTPTAAKAFFSGLLAVIIVTIAGFFIFGNSAGNLSHKEFAQISAVATGIYTGGIPNIAAIAKGVGLSDSLYIMVTSYDLIATGCYLIFVIFFGKTVFRKLLPSKIDAHDIDTATDAIVPKDTLKKKLMLAALAIATAGVSYGITILICGSLNIAILILILTTIALVLAQIRPIHEQNSSFDMGLYVVYVFCLAIATQVNIHELKILENICILWYIFFIIFGSLLLQILFAKIIKLDGDTVMVCSVALINSPPFVPMVAGLLGNRQIIITGVSIGLLGYALGNYLALGLYQLLLIL